MNGSLEFGGGYVLPRSLPRMGGAALVRINRKRALVHRDGKFKTWLSLQ